MLSLLKSMLCSAQTPDELVESCIRALAVAHQTETEYIERVHEIIADVSDYDAESEDISASDAAFRQLRTVSIVGVVLEVRVCESRERIVTTGSYATNPFSSSFRFAHCSTRRGILATPSSL